MHQPRRGAGATPGSQSRSVPRHISPPLPNLPKSPPQLATFNITNHGTHTPRPGPRLHATPLPLRNLLHPPQRLLQRLHHRPGPHPATIMDGRPRRTHCQIRAPPPRPVSHVAHSRRPMSPVSRLLPALCVLPRAAGDPHPQRACRLLPR